MKNFVVAALVAVLISFLSVTGWFSVFGYDPYISAPENIVKIYTTPSFWIGFGIWSLLYLLLVTLPLTFLFRKKKA